MEKEWVRETTEEIYKYIYFLKKRKQVFNRKSISFSLFSSFGFLCESSCALVLVSSPINWIFSSYFLAQALFMIMMMIFYNLISSFTFSNRKWHLQLLHTTLKRSPIIFFHSAHICFSIATYKMKTKKKKI